MKWLIPVAVLLALPARAGLDECNDDFSECRETCTVEFGGSIREEVKKKFNKCMKKCGKKLNLCTERAVETKSNALDEGALDKAPGSREVDENGMPERTAAKKRDDDAPARRDDELRVQEPKPKDAPPAREERAEKRAPKEELREEEVPRSSRTKLDKVEKAEAPKREPKASEERAAAPPPKETEEIKVELKPDRRPALDEDVRDDSSSSSSSAPPAREEKKKKEEKKKDPPKKEEDHDDLRFY